MYEGTPDTPHKGRFWEIVEKYKVTILYTAPTLIRTMMKWGDDIPAGYDLSSLRLLGSVGEPINPEAWMWYREHIGRGALPDRGHLVADRDRRDHDLAAARRDRDQAGLGDDARCPASSPTWSTTRAESVPNGGGGFLVLREPWPSMLRTIWGDDERFIDTYWSRFGGAGTATTGSTSPATARRRTTTAHLWLLGRVDDVMLISGHNISTTEVESALVSHPSVAEAAVVGATDPTTGQAIVAFAIPRGNVDTDGEAGEALIEELRNHVAKTLGPIAKPRQIMLVPELPKTRSGKIMRRLLRTWPRTARSATSRRCRTRR